MKKDYIILTDYDKQRLQIVVKEYMSRGYMPIGGIAVDNSPTGPTYFIQAMILVENERDSNFPL